MAETTPVGDVTLLLDRLSGGQQTAFDQLMPLVYNELRQQAARFLRRERANHTLQPTALVHEAFFKLVNQRNARWQGRAHFFAIAAQAMRRILVDHARANRRIKRGGPGVQVTLDEALLQEQGRSIDVIALDESLRRLAATDERQARVVELRFFGGLSVEETAEVMELSPATIKREWSMAKARLYAELTGGGMAGSQP